MRFGDYIRELRQNHQWTQPVAAKEIGIEQSYLSKLESGKSYPSEDVFSSIMAVYKIDIQDLREKVFPADLDHLREISEVRASILSSEKDGRARVQMWLFAGICALVIGGACLGAALLAKDTQVSTYEYRSEGVTREGEGADAFEIVGDGPFDKAPALEENRQEMLGRVDEQFKSLADYRGVVFFENVSGGRRIWRFFGSTDQTVPSPLRWFMIPAFGLILGGFGCFFASYRTT